MLIGKFNKRFLFLLFDLDFYSKYAWIVSLKNKKGIPVTKAFQEILDESGRKPGRR